MALRPNTPQKMHDMKLEPKDIDRERAMERFVWKPGDIKILKKSPTR